MSGSEHGSTLTSSVVAGVREVISATVATDSPPAGTTRLTEWLKAHAAELGLRYTSELARRRDRTSRYASNWVS